MLIIRYQAEFLLGLIDFKMTGQNSFSLSGQIWPVAAVHQTLPHKKGSQIGPQIAKQIRKILLFSV